MECPQGTCDEAIGLRERINKVEICSSKKMGVWQFILLLAGMLGVITTITLYSMAAEKKQNEKIAEIPVIQKDIEHIKTDVKEIKQVVKDGRKDRKADIVIIHKRITDTENKILRAIERLDK